MICTLLSAALLSLSPTTVDQLVTARENDDLWANVALIKSEDVWTSDPFKQRIRLIADDGRIALIELHTGKKAFTRLKYDIVC